jgi:hypothetical protein
MGLIAVIYAADPKEEYFAISENDKIAVDD